MSAYSELAQKSVIDRTPLDNAVLFSRHGDVQQAAAQLAALEAVAEAARDVLNTAVVYDDKCGRCTNESAGHNSDCVVVVLQQKLYAVEKKAGR